MSPEQIGIIVTAATPMVLGALKMFSDARAAKSPKEDDHDDDELYLVAIEQWYDFLLHQRDIMREKCLDVPLPCAAALGAMDAAPYRDKVKGDIATR